MNSRTATIRKWGNFFPVLLFLTFWPHVPARAAAGEPVVPILVFIQSGTETGGERAIQPGQVHAFRVELSEKLAYPLTVKCLGAMLEVDILNPDGRLVAQAESYLGDQATIRAGFIPKVSGIHEFRIRYKSDVEPGGPGKYVISVLPQRPPSEIDLDVQISLLNETRALLAEGRLPEVPPILAAARKNLPFRPELVSEHHILSAFYALKRRVFFSGHGLLMSAWFNYRRHNLPEGELFCLRTLARSRAERGSFRIANGLLEQALEIYRSGNGRRVDFGIALSEMGENEFRAGDFSAAERHKREAFDIFRKIGNAELASKTTAELARVLSSAGRLDESLSLYRGVLTCETFQQPFLAGLWLEFAETQGKAGLNGDADASFREAVGRYRALGLPENEADALNRRGRLFLRSNHLPAAQTAFSEALAVSRRGEDARRTADILLNLARTSRKLGDLDAALRHIQAALELVERDRKSLASADERLTFSENTRDFYLTHCAILLDLNQRFPDRGFAQKALLTMERGRARTLLETLHSKDLLFRSAAAPEQSNLEAWARGTLTMMNEARIRIPKERRGWMGDAMLEDALDEYFRNLKKTDSKSLRFRRLEDAPALDWSDVRQLLDRDTVFLEYAFLEDRSVLWLVSGQDVEVFSLPAASVIDALARETHRAISFRETQTRFLPEPERQRRVQASDRAFSEHSKRLADLIFPFEESKIAGKRLVIVGDGALHFIPFAALPLPGSDRPLVTACEVTQLPSLGTLKSIREDARARPPATRTLAVFADPVFSSGDERVKPLPYGAKPGMPTAPPASRDVLADFLNDRMGGVGRLPFSKVEADALLSLVPDGQGQRFEGFAANLENFGKLHPEQYRFIHFATHSFSDTTRPDLSAIVLTLVDENGYFLRDEKHRYQGGFLQAFDVFNLDFPVEMVVLSGCRTALGQENRGEGLIGLSRAFLSAGASRVMSSLWSVPDESTSVLMAETYRGMLGPKKLSPSAALREAQLKMMKNKRWSAPFYWAPFVIQGEPR